MRQTVVALRFNAASCSSISTGTLQIDDQNHGQPQSKVQKFDCEKPMKFAARIPVDSSSIHNKTTFLQHATTTNAALHVIPPRRRMLNVI
jgi:hypothetical protein